MFISAPLPSPWIHTMDLPSGVNHGSMSGTSFDVNACDVPDVAPSRRSSRSVLPLPVSRSRWPAKASCLSFGDHTASVSPGAFECRTNERDEIVTTYRPALTEYTIFLRSFEMLGAV